MNQMANPPTSPPPYSASCSHFLRQTPYSLSLFPPILLYLVGAFFIFLPSDLQWSDSDADSEPSTPVAPRPRRLRETSDEAHQPSTPVATQRRPLHERSEDRAGRLRSMARLMALAALIMMTTFSLIYGMVNIRITDGNRMMNGTTIVRNGARWNRIMAHD